MSDDSSYWTGLVYAWMLRIGLFGGLLAILALGACSPVAMPSLPDFSGKAVPPISIGGREPTAGTRNDIPPTDGGCHEKSDSAPYKATG